MVINTTIIINIYIIIITTRCQLLYTPSAVAIYPDYQPAMLAHL